MAFKINGTTVDLATITSGIDFGDQIVPYSRGCATAPTNYSFTDDQRFLRDRKLIAYISSSNFSSISNYTDNYGLVKQSYRTGTITSSTNYIPYTVNWTENNDTQNVGGLCPDRSNHSATTYSSRWIYDSGTYNKTGFLCYASWTSDGCLKFLCLL